MSDDIVRETNRMTDKMVANSKEQLKKLQKIKAMSKLARDLGEPTEAADRFIDVSETVLKDIIGKLGPKKKD